MFKFAARVWIILLAIGMVLSLSLNIAVVGFASVSAAVSGIYDAVTGTKSAFTILRKQVSSKDARISSLVDERGQLTAEVKSNKAHIGQLTDDIAVKESRIVSLSKEVARLSDEVSVPKHPKTVPYRGKRRLLTEAITDTNGRIASRTATAASRNASSVIAEAIPYLGVAAMLAVTAYDLKDSCDTIKDLHALDVAIDPTKEFGPDETEVCGLRVPSKEEVWRSAKDNSSEAWEAAKEYLPDLPEFKLPSWRGLTPWHWFTPDPR